MPIFHDVKIAVRRLAARPAYTLLILGTLALGIGAATAVFSVVDQTILRPAPFPHADRLVDVMHIHSVRKSGGSSMTPQKTLGWQGQPSLFERLELYAHQQMDVTGGAEPERLTGLNVSLGLFEMLAARPRSDGPFQLATEHPARNASSSSVTRSGAAASVAKPTSSASASGSTRRTTRSSG